MSNISAKKSFADSAPLNLEKSVITFLLKIPGILFQIGPTGVVSSSNGKCDTSVSFTASGFCFTSVLSGAMKVASSNSYQTFILVFFGFLVYAVVNIPIAASKSVLVLVFQLFIVVLSFASPAKALLMAPINFKTLSPDKD